jgi:glucose/arabinose dehydrogenase
LTVGAALRRRRAVAVALAPALLAVAACSASSSDDDGDVGREDPLVSETTAVSAVTTTTIPPPAGTLDQVQLSVQEIAAVDRPTALAARPSSPDLYVAEKGGRVRIIDVTEATPRSRARYQLFNTPVLDLSDEVRDEGNEQGLLGLAFSSDGRMLYVNFTAEPDGRTVVLEYEMSERSSNGTVDTGSRRQLLEVPQPAANHNGGNLVTGPDGYLYIGMGDGGGGGDPEGHGQDLSTLLGSILRIDPYAGTEGSAAYGIPAGNPFAGSEDAAPETWIYGVRNPWRFSFDRDSGDLWVADVGQSSWEEIDLLPSAGGFDAGRGANLGWDEMEGTHPFDGGSNPGGAVLPIYEYSTEEGCSIIGGYVYRGDAVPPLQGTYLFADYCTVGVRGIQVDGTTVIDERTWDLPAQQVQSFGQDNDGELLLLLTGGQVLKLVAPDADV